MTARSCQKARDRLAQLVSGEMEPQARREIEAHLRACPDCAAEAESIRRALALLETEDPPDPGARYWSSYGSRVSYVRASVSWTLSKSSGWIRSRYPRSGANSAARSASRASRTKPSRSATRWITLG